jgi:hypothetical protein
MPSAAGRNKRLESAVSILLLVVLFLIALAVLIKQADVDMTRFGLGAAAQPDSQITPDLAALTPDGFKELSSPLVYTAGNLYEKINGKAPLYLDAGFLKLFTQRFVSRTDETLWMELYLFDMATLKNAFSVYSVQKRADVETLAISRMAGATMQFAYKTTNALYFVHGRYYVELLGSAESPDLLEAMKNVADSITAGLKVDEEAQISELDLFPTDNLVSGSFKLSLKDTFGFADLTDTFTCRYDLNGQSVTAFISTRSDPKNAQKIAGSYSDFLVENDAKPKSTANETIKKTAAKVFDFYDTTEIVFFLGPYVGGVHEAEDQKTAEEVAVMLINRLTDPHGAWGLTKTPKQ